MSNLSDLAGSRIRAESGRVPQSSTETGFWSGPSWVVVDDLVDNWQRTTETYVATRQQHYFSAEFLMGRALLNNLLGAGLVDEASAAAEKYGKNLIDVLEAEHDAALGNDGLGRLAACLLDSCATRSLPVTGYGILYRYGLFKQTFEDGFQSEHPDPWMGEGCPFAIRREELSKIITFGDLVVRAVPYDMPIIGYDTDDVGTLHLWHLGSVRGFDYDAFNSQRFTDTIVERERIHDLRCMLYPNDSIYDDKVLRVRQQYFFVSTSLQTMIDSYIENHGEDLRDFHKYNSIQLNDTHPVLAIPELMRLLLDEHDTSWGNARNVVSNTFAYTNHTVLAEALETREYSIFDCLFGHVLEITREIDRHFHEDLVERGFDQGKIDYMAPISHGHIHMAWIACYAAYSIDGVAALHTETTKRETLKDWHDIWPERFNNKTNGVTPHRWLNQCNPRLSALLARLSGSDAWVTDLDRLAELGKFADDEAALREILDIKHENKKDSATWLEHHQGISVNPDAIFDTQIKHLHKYKRRLLNALYILDLYYRIKEDPVLDVPPRVFTFGTKAAPGYARAKAIIKFINAIADKVNNGSDMEGRLQIAFVENYNVTPAEHIIPITDISEQISTAGEEASGTSNMKLMMNGVLTLGTMDGANAEIVDAAGEENAYIFGALEEELPELRRTYSSRGTYEMVPGLKRAVDSLVDGTLADGGSGMFHDPHFSLLESNGYEPANVYYVLGDSVSYRETCGRMAGGYRDELAWAKKCFLNIIRSDRFSSDRTIHDYANEVWKLEETKI